jgi:hypothetical protein
MQSKLPHIGTSIFTVMSQFAVKHNAINLGQGFAAIASLNHSCKLEEWFGTIST